MLRVPRLPWRGLRRLGQLVFLALFLWLFRRTELSASADLPTNVNLWFRIDPLVNLAATLGAAAVITLAWPALVLIALTVLLGRFFCGWVCPLGTLLDLAHRLFRPLARRANRLALARLHHLRPARFVILVIVLLAALMGLPLVGLVDPFSLLVRAMTFTLDPAWFNIATDANTWMADHGPRFLSDHSEAVYQFLRAHALPFKHASYAMGGVSLAILGGLFGLEFVGRRFWCRYLCPLGALLGVCSRRSVLRRLPSRACGNCKSTHPCAASCRMAAFDGQGRFSPECCDLCMDCIAQCSQRVAALAVGLPRAPAAPVGLSRRVLIGSVTAGIAIPTLWRAARAIGGTPVDPHLIRPPGVADDRHFLDVCVRCGACMKVCPTGALQPSALDAGIGGLFAPRIVPRMGYCEYACTLCGQICPTGAIPSLLEEAKVRVSIGIAEFDRARCLPWAQNEPCICCEEHCPIPEKAIKLIPADVVNAQGEKVTIERPYVDRALCIGCGICENKCPIDSPAGIRVWHKAAAPQAPAASQRAGA